jgi:hypothetical protein
MARLLRDLARLEAELAEARSQVRHRKNGGALLNRWVGQVAWLERAVEAARETLPQ